MCIRDRYKGSKILSGGVESYWKSPNALVVEAKGNAYTSKKRVADYVFLRAAESAIASGFTHFVMQDQQDRSSTRQGVLNTPQTTTFNATASGYGDVYGTATTTGGTQLVTYYFPGKIAVFLMFEGEPEGYRPGQYFTVSEVYNELGEKYLKDFSPLP